MKRSILLGLILIIGCQLTSKNKFLYNSIKGTWIFKEGKDGYYERLEFSPSSVIIYTFGDTILGYKYILKGGNLIFQNNNEAKIINKIFKFTNDSLVFTSSLFNKNMQLFVRKIGK
jgi:hypothetical protein